MPSWGDKFRQRLANGKYSDWAARADEDTLEALFYAVDAYGAAMNVAKQVTGDYPWPVMRAISAKERVLGALDLLVRTHAGDPIEYSMPSAWDRQFDKRREVFDETLQNRLGGSSQTMWAQTLTERNLALLIWMVGEYSIRTHQIERMPGGTPETDRVATALEAISWVCWGKLRDAAAARSRLDEQG